MSMRRGFYHKFCFLLLIVMEGLCFGQSYPDETLELWESSVVGAQRIPYLEIIRQDSYSNGLNLLPNIPTDYMIAEPHERRVRPTELAIVRPGEALPGFVARDGAVTLWALLRSRSTGERVYVFAPETAHPNPAHNVGHPMLSQRGYDRILAAGEIRNLGKLGAASAVDLDGSSGGVPTSENSQGLKFELNNNSGRFLQASRLARTRVSATAMEVAKRDIQSMLAGLNRFSSITKLIVNRSRQSVDMDLTPEQEALVRASLEPTSWKFITPALDGLDNQGAPGMPAISGMRGGLRSAFRTAAPVNGLRYGVGTSAARDFGVSPRGIFYGATALGLGQAIARNGGRGGIHFGANFVGGVAGSYTGQQTGEYFELTNNQTEHLVLHGGNLGQGVSATGVYVLGSLAVGETITAVSVATVGLTAVAVAEAGAAVYLTGELLWYGGQYARRRLSYHLLW